MKEVKVLDFVEMAGAKGAGVVKNSASHRKNLEESLASWLNAGWRIAGTGGRWLGEGIVILVRNRVEPEPPG